MWGATTSHPTLINNTIADNHVDDGVGSALSLRGIGELAVLSNNLLIGETGSSAIHCEPRKVKLPKMLHNDVFSPAGSAVSGPRAEDPESAGNISVDPRLDPSWRPAADSPVIEAGDMSVVGELEPIDFLKMARVVDGDLDAEAVIDIGAIEFQRGVPEIPSLSPAGALALAALLGAMGVARCRR